MPFSEQAHFFIQASHHLGHGRFARAGIADEDGTVYLYYASSDTRMHVAVSTIDKLVDYCMNTPPDGLRSAASVETLKKLIGSNLKLQKKN